MTRSSVRFELPSFLYRRSAACAARLSAGSAYFADRHDLLLFDVLSHLCRLAPPASLRPMSLATSYGGVAAEKYCSV